MAAAPSLPESGRPGLYLEPVIGWRIWRLERDAHGRLVLVSPVRSYRWRPMEANRASRCCRTCLHPGTASLCECGLYAVARLEQLPRIVMGLSARAVVVGSVAMWGKVVEHAFGYRGEYAYPDRLRLVCGRCFASGRVGSPTRVVGGNASSGAYAMRTRYRRATSFSR